MDSQHRLDRVRDDMVQQAIDLLAVPPGDDLQYLLGFSPHPDERPCYLFLTTEAVVFLVPEVNAKQSASYVSDPLLTYVDAEGPGRVLTEARKRFGSRRSEEHTSELQSQFHLVCRLLLEKKKK